LGRYLPKTRLGTHSGSGSERSQSFRRFLDAIERTRAMNQDTDAYAAR
jgi:hypothetical protein